MWIKSVLQFASNHSQNYVFRATDQYRFRASISYWYLYIQYRIFNETAMGGQHLILILACNWLPCVDKNVLFENMEMSSTKMILMPRNDSSKQYT
jgi:hypothetical protein